MTSVIPISSQLYQTLQDLAQNQRMVFITGLPGAGKSLLVQQLALIASQAGRQVHLLQYDITRKDFETEKNLHTYPELEGFTDPAIRKAVGSWARDAVTAWHEHHAKPEHMLIAELPLIGNRFTELVIPTDDEAETLLASDQATFVIPVPSWEVREVIEKTRAQTITDPQNTAEKLDAPPNVLQALWQEINALARHIGLTKASATTPYNPYIYGGVYSALLKHRQHQALFIEEVLKPKRSVHELVADAKQLRPSTTDVKHYMNLTLKAHTAQELAKAADTWHSPLTRNLPLPDPGPQLMLPLPETLPTAPQTTTLTPEQHQALYHVLTLPLSDTSQSFEHMLQALEHARSLFVSTADITKAEVHKFDVYDSYFHVMRTQEESGQQCIAGLLQTYQQVMENLQAQPHTLTVVEVPLLRLGLEASLAPFLLTTSAPQGGIYA